MGFKADQRIANTNLTDTFDAWRINTNLVVTRMNAFANGEFQLSANSLNANTEFVVGGANNQPGIANVMVVNASNSDFTFCLLYTSPSPRDKRQSRMPSSA